MVDESLLLDVEIMQKEHEKAMKEKDAEIAELKTELEKLKAMNLKTATP